MQFDCSFAQINTFWCQFRKYFIWYFNKASQLPYHTNQRVIVCTFKFVQIHFIRWNWVTWNEHWFNWPFHVWHFYYEKVIIILMHIKHSIKLSLNSFSIHSNKICHKLMLFSMKLKIILFQWKLILCWWSNQLLYVQLWGLLVVVWLKNCRMIMSMKIWLNFQIEWIIMNQSTWTFCTWIFKSVNIEPLLWWKLQWMTDWFKWFEFALPITCTRVPRVRFVCRLIV